MRTLLSYCANSAAFLCSLGLIAIAWLLLPLATVVPIFVGAVMFVTSWVFTRRT